VAQAFLPGWLERRARIQATDRNVCATDTPPGSSGLRIFSRRGRGRSPILKANDTYPRPWGFCVAPAAASFFVVRRLVEAVAPRCPECRLPSRWCVCGARIEVRCALAVDVLVHHREWFRPSSTSTLIARVMPEARAHLWRRERHVTVEQVRQPGREVWLLHPHGEPAPERSPEEVQVILLDGSWPESSGMVQEVGRWGRLVSLPMQGESRYWLRAQQDQGRFSTVEALLFVLRQLGLNDAHAALQVQFELQVYASLRARGKKQLAEEFLVTSPIAAALPEFLARLNEPRSRAPAGG